MSAVSGSVTKTAAQRACGQFQSRLQTSAVRSVNHNAARSSAVCGTPQLHSHFVATLRRQSHHQRGPGPLLAMAGANLIDGKATAATIRKETAEEVASLKSKTGKVPGLAVVLVGGRKDSETYVRNKKKACAEVGIVDYGADLPEDASLDDVLQVVQGYNRDDSVHGILVQLPLPAHIDEQTVLDSIAPEKDVDGFGPANIGRLAMRGREPSFVACTPKGCMELLKREGVQLAGKRAVVVGRSNIVGTPAALLLQKANATVTVVHSQTPNGAEICREADVVIAACGKAEMLTGDWIKEGAVVIDVGINAVDDAEKKRGYRLVGDVNFAEAKEKASLITPVPGGVGPMTIAMLLTNTLLSFKRSVNQA